jgi:hypothetical protein
MLLVGFNLFNHLVKNAGEQPFYVDHQQLLTSNQLLGLFSLNGFNVLPGALFR